MTGLITVREPVLRWTVREERHLRFLRRLVRDGRLTGDTGIR